MIHVLATITAKPGQREALLALFRDVIPKVHAEQGCIEYGPAIDTDGLGDVQTLLGEDTFVVVEKWETVADLRAHAAAPHMAEYAGNARELIASRVIHVLTPAQ